MSNFRNEPLDAYDRMMLRAEQDFERFGRQRAADQRVVDDLYRRLHAHEAGIQEIRRELAASELLPELGLLGFRDIDNDIDGTEGVV